MANEEHLAKLEEGVEAWNAWRSANRDIEPDLSGVDLRDVYLKEADFYLANLVGVDLSKAFLNEANLCAADLRGANLSGANLGEAILNTSDLSGAELSGAYLWRAELDSADLSEANLEAADLSFAKLRFANLSGTDLERANLAGANLDVADLSRAKLQDADLQLASLVQTDLAGANLDGSQIYGTSVWDPKLDAQTSQRDLVITPPDQAEVTVDNIKVAQFIYLLLSNPEIRDVIDTITSKVVLILGRFTEERKAVLDALRDELRERNYTPVLFDFEKPDSKDVTGTVETLARMSRFIIADLTDPSSIPHELATTVPFLRTTPVQLLRLQGEGGYSMSKDLEAYPWVSEPHEYEDGESLIASLSSVLASVENKVRELRPRDPSA